MTDQQTDNPNPRRISPLRWIVSIFVCFWVMMAFVYLNTGKLRAMEVISRSMEPTILVGDRLIISRYLEGDLNRGDVVVINSPTDDGPQMVKRVMGLPGERLQMNNGELRIDGAVQRSQEGPSLYFAGTNNFDMIVPGDHYFLVGDNRANSFDSRDFGPIERKMIEGKVSFRYAPWSRRGSVE